MDIYSFPLPLDYGEREIFTEREEMAEINANIPKEYRFMQNFYPEYARLLSPVVSQVVREYGYGAGFGSVSASIYDEIDRETLAQMSDRVMEIAMQSIRIQSQETSPGILSHTLAKIMILMEINFNS